MEAKATPPKTTQVSPRHPQGTNQSNAVGP